MNDYLNRSIHRQNINDIKRNINANYLSAELNSKQTQSIIKENDSLSERSNSITMRFIEEQQKTLKITDFNIEQHKKFFYFFKLLIAEIETSVELLKIISQDKPELEGLIREAIIKNNKRINTSENYDNNMKEMIKSVFLK